MSATYSVTSSSTAPGWAEASASLMCAMTSRPPIVDISRRPSLPPLTLSDRIAKK